MIQTAEHAQPATSGSFKFPWKITLGILLLIVIAVVLYADAMKAKVYKKHLENEKLLEQQIKSGNAKITYIKPPNA